VGSRTGQVIDKKEVSRSQSAGLVSECERKENPDQL
jgi:hypothetical protein